MSQFSEFGQTGDEAALAIDAMSALVEGLGDRLGEHVTPLREALSQLRVAFVQIKQAVEEVFRVKVTGVNTLNRQGKRRRTRTGVGGR